MKKECLLFFLLFYLFVSCASIQFDRREIVFPEAYLLLGVQEIGEDELFAAGIDIRNGILLRFKAGEGETLKYNESGKIYSQVENNEGYMISLDADNLMRFEKVSDGRWIVSSERTTSNKSSEKISQRYYMDDRGSIELISSSGKSSAGRIYIEEWHRSALFPDRSVKPGDKWTYNEKMRSRIDSFWLKKSSNTPDEINAMSEFEGFARIGDKICAVISTNVIHRKKEILDTTFKTLSLQMNIYAKEKLFFDFINGKIQARILETDSFTISDEENFYDHSKARSIMRRVDDKEEPKIK